MALQLTKLLMPIAILATTIFIYWPSQSVISSIFPIKPKNKKFTKKSIEDALNFPGYEVWFPKQWDKYGHTRIIVIVKTDLAVKELASPTIEDLPVIMVEIGTQREPKTRLGFIYREYTSFITGLNTLESQELRLDRTLQALKVLTTKDQNCLIMGDINVDHDRLQEPGYHLASLARRVTDFQTDQGYTQMVEGPTREQLVKGDCKKESARCYLQ